MMINKSDDSAADFLDHYIGSYRLLRLLGRGGFASVYLGEHRYLKRLSAIKVLRTLLNEQDKERFLKEARLLANLSHPHIVRVLDFAVAQRVSQARNGEFTEYIPYLAMDFAPGGSLRTFYPAGSCLFTDVVVGYIRQLASALQYAHDNGIIHRDVKPENCLLNEQQEVMLSDFGMALFAPTPDLLSTQQMAGTLPYTAPEQLRGKPGFASDQYSLAIMAYEWLCGHRPFEGEEVELILQQMSSPPPRLRSYNSAISQAIEEVILKALEKDPQRRYPSVQAFADALERASQRTSSNVFPYAHPAMRAFSPGQRQENMKAEPFSFNSETRPVPLRKTKKPHSEEKVYTQPSEQEQVARLFRAPGLPQKLLSFSLKREKRRISFAIGIIAFLLILGSSTLYLKALPASLVKAHAHLVPTPVTVLPSLPGAANFTVNPIGVHGMVLVTNQTDFQGDHSELGARQVVITDFFLPGSAGSGKSKQVEVFIRALVSRFGSNDGYAPVSLYCNGQRFVLDFTFPGDGYQPDESSFQIPPGLLVYGKNELKLIVSSRAQSELWLYSIGIMPGTPL